MTKTPSTRTVRLVSTTGRAAHYPGMLRWKSFTAATAQDATEKARAYARRQSATYKLVPIAIINELGYTLVHDYDLLADYAHARTQAQ